MGKTKFTPGPWTAEDESINLITIRAASQSAHKLGQEIASVMNEEGSDLTPIMWADARLIAASPDLYEAGRKVLDGLNARIKAASDAGGQSVPVFDGIAELHAALKLVEGESQ